MMDVSLHGIGELQAQLARLSGRENRSAVSKAMRAGANIIKDRIAQLVPVDSGNLKRGIKVRSAKTRRGSVAFSILLPSRERLSIDHGDKYYYPIAVEYGHPAPDRKHAQPISYIRRGYDETESAALHVFESTYAAMIRSLSE